MNSLERCLAVIKGEVPDRVPVVPENYLFSIRFSGYKMKDVCRNGTLLAKALLKTQEEFGYDGVTVDLDNAASAEALGCSVEFREDDPAVVHGPAIDRLEDIDKLRLPDPYRDGRLPVYVECVRYLSEQAGKEIFIYAFFDQAPFSLASLVIGAGKFMTLLAEGAQLELIHHLIDFCRQAAERFAQALIESGAHLVGMGDAIASPDVVSPTYYNDFAFPYEKMLIENIRKFGVPTGIHICGNATRILPKLVETGADLLDIDYKVDLATIKAVCAGRVAARGTIDPASVMRYGSPTLVEEKCRQAIELLGKDGRLILSTGCDMMRDTPYENLHMMVKTAKKYGQYMAVRS